MTWKVPIALFFTPRNYRRRRHARRVASPSTDVLRRALHRGKGAETRKDRRERRHLDGIRFKSLVLHRAALSFVVEWDSHTGTLGFHCYPPRATPFCSYKKGWFVFACHFVVILYFRVINSSYTILHCASCALLDKLHRLFPCFCIFSSIFYTTVD